MLFNRLKITDNTLRTAHPSQSSWSTHHFVSDGRESLTTNVSELLAAVAVAVFFCRRSMKYVASINDTAVSAIQLSMMKPTW